MKAKELIQEAQDMKERGESEAAVAKHVINRLLKDAEETLRKRTAGRAMVLNTAMDAVFREADDKYRVIARTLGWSPNGFKETLDDLIKAKNAVKSI